MTGEETAPIESKPEVNLPKPNEVYFDEAAKKKLSEIIDEINAAYNKNFDVDHSTAYDSHDTTRNNATSGRVLCITSRSDVFVPV